MGAASAAAPTAGLAAAAAQTIADQIEALQAQIAGLYDHMPFGSHTVATDGTYASVNALTLAWTGCTRESLIGKRRPAEFLSPPSRQTVPRSSQGRQARPIPFRTPATSRQSTGTVPPECLLLTSSVLHQEVP